MTVPTTALPDGWPTSPIAPSPTLGRPLRQDGLGTLGISSQSLAEAALEQGHWDLALELADYFRTEIGRLNEILFIWLTDILDYRLAKAGATESGMGDAILRGFRRFDPGAGDLLRVKAAIAAHDAEGAAAAIELMRVRWAAQHDGLVVWIQEVQTEIAERRSEKTPSASR